MSTHMVVEAVLENVHRSLQKDGLVVGLALDEFIERFREVPKKTHPTLCKLSIEIDFPRGGSFSDSNVIPIKFLKWLEKNCNVVNLGEVCGKHSDVSASFAEFDYDDDAYEVGNGIVCIPGYLDCEWDAYVSHILERTHETLRKRGQWPDSVSSRIKDQFSEVASQINETLEERIEDAAFDKISEIAQKFAMDSVESELDAVGAFDDESEVDDYYYQQQFEKLKYTEFCDLLREILKRPESVEKRAKV